MIFGTPHSLEEYNIFDNEKESERKREKEKHKNARVRQYKSNTCYVKSHALYQLSPRLQ